MLASGTMSPNTSFGDRMKAYERQETGRRLLPLLPVVARIDGKSFSRFTQGLKRPYDPGLSKLLVATTIYLVQETNALCGYTQSDELSLLFFSSEPKSQIFFDGKIQKMNSVLASMTAAYFNTQKSQFLPDKATELANFDSRVWAVPNAEEAANVFLWRERDATKNSISMAARELFSHKELLGKSLAQIQEMLFHKGVNWNDYPASFKRGTFVQRSQTEDSGRQRSKVEEVNMPPFDSVTNRIEVLFEGASPETAKKATNGS